nr:uncharacterized protein LOC111426687 isoform X2 [Onthophagus taurus]XP_022917088.1 uncharacterized protein LOC111426687 isoform X2 [Onthophagus taurus]
MKFLRAPMRCTKLDNIRNEDIRKQLEIFAVNDNINDQKLIHKKSVAERFVQRLICGVGMLDDRFATKYLISLDEDFNENQAKMTYLFRIDALSTPVLYPDDKKLDYFLVEDDDLHPGFGKIQLKDDMMKEWGEFVNLNHFLRRDKIQSKIVELLAKAASKTDLTNIDESILCGSPGKIVSPSILNKILHSPSQNHLYFGSEKNFPHTKDFRIAIVDEPEGIRIHLEFLSPILNNQILDIRVLVGINLDFWPKKSDFPLRVSLAHTDCLLYHLSAKSGMFLVGFGVHSSSWQIRFPAAEEIILDHYDEMSTVKMVLKVISLILIEINERYYENKFFGYYVVKSMVFYELENDDSYPTMSIVRWGPVFLSTIVLRVLDKLIKLIRSGFCPNYFFGRCNLIFNPGHLSDEDYFMESCKIQEYLTRLFDESLKLFNNSDYLRMIESIRIEMVLIDKWRGVIRKMSPPKSTRARRFLTNFKRSSIFAQYTQKQMEYIGMVLKNVLEVKKKLWRNEKFAKKVLTRDDLTEDVVYVLVLILDQAKNVYLKNLKSNNEKIKSNFSSSTNKLVRFVRKDIEINYETITDDVEMVKILLKWLYKAMDQSKKYFAPILRPYLNSLFNNSHEISWHIEELTKKLNIEDELESMGIFTTLVNQKRITPASGVINGYQKKWNWAKNIVDLLQNNNKLKLIFIPKRGEVLNYLITTQNQKNRKDIFEHQQSDLIENKSIFSNYLDNINQNKILDPNQPLHNTLKNNSPLKLIFNKIHRNGYHRCAGDIFRTLITMHKSHVLIDILVNNYTNQENSVKLIDYIKKIKCGIESKRNNAEENRLWSQTLPKFEKNKVLIYDENDKKKFKEKYTLIREDFDTKDKVVLKFLNDTSLLGSCRAARLKDTKSILYIEESFKLN